MFILSSFIICVITLRHTIAISVKCELDVTSLGDEMTCNMQQTTTIDSDKVSIASKRDETISELNMSGNKKIFFLPIRADKNFPNLTKYNAHDCSLTSLSMEPFRNLRTLKMLNLNKNRIENIAINSFDDLADLEALVLGMPFYYFIICFFAGYENW